LNSIYQMKSFDTKIDRFGAGTDADDIFLSLLLKSSNLSLLSQTKN
jgi:hypothetical protein